jgi:low temperature requirement protein LtrA
VGTPEESADSFVETEQRVTPLELFFDLVFVLSITQVTALMSAHPSWEAVGQGMLVLAALWWAWAAYSWLTNTLDPEQDGTRLAVLAAMAAMLVVALAVPQAFGDDAILFGGAYFAVRALHILLYEIAARSRGDEELHTNVHLMAPGALSGPALLIVAGFLDGAAQAGLWALALAIDYTSPLRAGPGGWSLSPHHFAERYGLIVIIALGESIVAIGAGAAGIDLGAGEVAAALLGVGAAAALWWIYFDVVAIVTERRLARAQGADREALARDSYSYLHLALIAGIVLFSLGLKKTLAGVSDPLDTVPGVALCGGIALYLLGHIALRLRGIRTLNVQRLITAAVCLALIPLALNVAALVVLGGLTLLLAALIAYETISYGEGRTRLRASLSA